MKIRAILVVVAILMIGSARAEQTLVLNSVFYSPLTTENHDGLLDMVYQELARRLGIKIEIRNLAAAERTLINVNDGVVDGDVGRILGFEKQYPNMVSVPVPVMKFEMMVFSRNVDFRVAGPDSIKPYNIGIVRGWRILEQASVGAQSVTTFDSAEQMFSMLDKNRIDIALLEKLEGMQIVKIMGIKGVKILQPRLLEGYWHLYLNKKHESLIPQIAAELRKMEEDGSLKRINDSVQARYGR
jgi:polar amino acid transport system substrate-binding protein